MNAHRTHFLLAAATIFLCIALYASFSFASPSSLKVSPQYPFAAESSNAIVNHYDPRRDPAQDLALASAEAKSSNRNIFIIVGGEWCGWCHAMDRFFRDHPDLTALREKNYVLLKVSMSQENPNQRFLKRYPPIHGYPHIFILDANTKLLKSQPSNELEEGNSYNADRFSKLLDQFAPAGSH
jgi:thiol:disulfide interchange protein